MPRAFPFVFVLGFPKSGTSWVCQLLADYLRLPFPQHSILPIGCPAVVHGHEILTGQYPQAVYVVRDGRDAMVSMYFHIMGKTSGHKQSRVETRWGDRLPSQDAAESFSRFVRDQLRAPSGAPCHWGKHVRQSLASESGKTIVRYEELLADTAATLSRVAEQLTGTNPDPHSVRSTVDKYSFQRQTGRANGQEDRSSYLRNGCRGEWRDYFDRESRERFAAACGDALVAAGYEQDDSWVDGDGETRDCRAAG